MTTVRKDLCYWVRCQGRRHRVVLTKRGVRFLDHPEAWYERDREAALAVFSGEKLEHPFGCVEVATLVRLRLYEAPVSEGSIRKLFGRLRGKQHARRRWFPKEEAR